MLVLLGASRAAFGCRTGGQLREMQRGTLVKPPPKVSSPHELPWLVWEHLRVDGAEGRAVPPPLLPSQHHPRTSGSAAQGAAHCFHPWLVYLKQGALSRTYVLKYHSKCALGRTGKHLLPFTEDTWRSVRAEGLAVLFPQPACPCSSVAARQPILIRFCL